MRIYVFKSTSTPCDDLTDLSEFDFDSEPSNKSVIIRFKVLFSRRMIIIIRSSNSSSSRRRSIFDGAQSSDTLMQINPILVG